MVTLPAPSVVAPTEPLSLACGAGLSPEADAREVGRVVATVLLASGEPSPEDLERANECLARLARPALGERDFAVATPEELGPRIPLDLRGPLSEMLFDLAQLRLA